MVSGILLGCERFNTEIMGSFKIKVRGARIKSKATFRSRFKVLGYVISVLKYSNKVKGNASQFQSHKSVSFVLLKPTGF